MDTETMRTESGERIYTVDFDGFEYTEDDVGIRYVGPLGIREAARLSGKSRQTVHNAAMRDAPINGCVYVERGSRNAYWLAVLPYGGSLIAWAISDSANAIARSLGVRESLLDGDDVLRRAVRLAILRFKRDVLGADDGR